MPFLPDAALFCLFVFSFLSVGWILGNERRSILENSVLKPLLWLGVFGLILWILGLAGFYSPRFVALFSGVYLFLPLLVAPFSRPWRFGVRRFWQAPQSLSRTEKFLAVYLLGVSALTFLLTLAPPTGNDYDSLVYHLAVPAQYLREGRIVEFAYDHHSYFPFTLEMWFGAGLALRGAVFAKLFHWLMFPVCAALLVALGKRGGSREGGFWAAALFVSLPVALAEASTAYIDLGFTAFTLGALLCLLAAREEKENRVQYLALCGAFCGFSLGTKYFGALVFGFLGVWLLVEAIQTRRYRQLLAFALPALVLGLPWYARNAIWTGNPVFPFAFEIFGGEGWTLSMAKEYTASQQIYGFGKGPLDLLLLPWRLAMAPLNVSFYNDSGLYGIPFWPFSSQPIEGHQIGLFDVRGLFLQSFIGPSLLALGVPALLKSRKGALLPLAYFFGFLWIFWALTSQQIRYLFPALATLCVLGGWFLAESGQTKPYFRRVTVAVLSLWLLYAPTLTLWRAEDSWDVIAGLETPENFARRTFGAQLVFEGIGQSTPPNAKFAVYGEPRCFGLPRRYFWADPQHNTLVADQAENGRRSHSGGAPLSLYFALLDLGATHVLVNAAAGQNGGAFGPPPEFAEAVSRGYFREVFGARGYIVFQLAPENQVLQNQGRQNQVPQNQVPQNEEAR